MKLRFRVKYKHNRLIEAVFYALKFQTFNLIVIINVDSTTRNTVFGHSSNFLLMH